MVAACLLFLGQCWCKKNTRGWWGFPLGLFRQENFCQVKISTSEIPNSSRPGRAVFGTPWPARAASKDQKSAANFQSKSKATASLCLSSHNAPSLMCCAAIDRWAGSSGTAAFVCSARASTLTSPGVLRVCPWSWN